MSGELFDKGGGGTLEQRILRHVGRYRITTPHVIERLFINVDGVASHKESLKAAATILGSLVDETKLTRLEGASEAEPNSFAGSVYVLPDHKIKTGDDLARLWFCCLDIQRRHYTEYREMIELFTEEGFNESEGPHHNFFHALADEEGGPVLYRLYICRAEKKNARDKLRHSIKIAKPFRHWIDQGSYGVAVLVQSQQKKREIEELLSKSYGGKPTLNHLARFTVSVVPSEADYGTAIARYESEAWG